VARAGTRLVKDTTLYTLGIAVTRFANLLLLPLYLSLLSEQEYGALGVLDQLVQVLVILTMAGGMETLVKIGSDLRDTPDAQLRLVSTMMTWMLIAGFVVALTCALLWPWLHGVLGGIELWPMGIFALSGVAGSAAFQALSAHLLVTGDAKKHMAYAALRTLLNVVIAVPLLLFTDLGVNALLLATSVSFWTGTLLLAAQLPRGSPFAVDWTLLKRVLWYGVPLLPHLAASLIFQATDKFMLAASDKHGLAAVGVYSVGSRIASGVMMLGLGMQRAWLPYFFQEATLGDEASWGRVRRLSFWSMAGMAAAVAALALLSPELVELIAPSAYAAAAGVTAVLCLSALLRTGAQLSSSVVLNSPRAYQIWLASVPAAALNVALNYLFIPEYGALGAAWSTTVAMSLNLLFTVALSRRIHRVPFRYGAVSVLLVIVIALVVGAASAPLSVRLALCGVVPLLALAFDWQFVQAEVRVLLARRRRR
jgi:O-antigen/teichoic acid export membrane protein